MSDAGTHEHPSAVAELRILRRVADLQAREVKELQEQLSQLEGLHDEQRQLDEVVEVRSGLLELRDVFLPELRDLRARDEEQSEVLKGLRMEVEEARVVRTSLESDLQSQREAVAAAQAEVDAEREAAAHLAEENRALHERCARLVLDLKKAVEYSSRLEARLARIEGSAQEGLKERLDLAKSAEERQRKRADDLSKELAQLRIELHAARGTGASDRAVAAHASSRGHRTRHLLPLAAEVASTWAQVSSVGGVEGPFAGTVPRLRGGESDRSPRAGHDGAVPAPSPTQTHDGAHEEELQAKLQALHESYRNTLLASQVARSPQEVQKSHRLGKRI